MAKPARGSLCVFLRAPRRVVSLPADWHDGLQPCGDDDRERHDPLQKHPSRPFWQPHLHPHVATQPTDAHAGLWRDLHHVRLRTSPPPQPLGLRGRQPQLYDPRHSRWRDPERQHLVQPVATHAERSLATAHKHHASAGPARLRLAPGSIWITPPTFPTISTARITPIGRPPAPCISSFRPPSRRSPR